jgi:hypothetical protein
MQHDMKTLLMPAGTYMGPITDSVVGLAVACICMLRSSVIVNTWGGWSTYFLPTGLTANEGS